MASSPGISPPGLNWVSAFHEPSYSWTIQPTGTSARYACRDDSKTSAGDADVDADGRDDAGGAAVGRVGIVVADGRTLGGAVGPRPAPLQAAIATAIATSPRHRREYMTFASFRTHVRYSVDRPTTVTVRETVLS
jgi:hypothetical protein